MPGYCTVPFCKSRKGKVKDVSFHEIPSDADPRREWLKAISKQGDDKGSNFEPNGWTVVCSLHFQVSDFREGLKIRKLKPSAVPSVFPNYPSYMLPPPKKKRRMLKRSHSNTDDEFNNFSLPVLQEHSVHNQEFALENPEPGTSAASECDEVDNILEGPEHAPCVMSGVQCAESSLETKVHLEVKVKQLTRDVRNLKKTIERRNTALHKLQEKLDKLQEEVNEVRQNTHYKAFKKVITEVEEHGSVSGQFLIEQISNFTKKTPRYSEPTLRLCIAWRAKSTKGYEHVRRHGIFILPSRSTLKRYMGTSNAETGITALVRQRLQTEIQSLKPEEKFGSLIIDEMAINEKITYDKDLDRCFGFVEIGDNFENSNNKLADHLLCFILEGLSTSYTIPVAYFFSRSISGKDLHKLATDVIINVELCGFEIVRIVTDNFRSNTAMYRLFGKGILKVSVPHPLDSSRLLFLSFEPSHVMKNLWVQFLNREMSKNGVIITSKYVKKVVEIQQAMVFKPVRFLKRIHIEPTNFQKMRVYPAVQIFSPPVTAAIETLRDNPLCHPNGPFFSDSTESVEYMKTIYKWFRIHNVSNRTKFITSRDDNVMHFFSMGDERLQWLSSEFLMYMKQIERESATTGKEFLTQETAQALQQTSLATVGCIKYLLHRGFAFVFTRNFSSDPIEKFYGALRQMCGGNDIIDMRAAVFAIEGILKAGIALSAKDKPIPVRGESIPVADRQESLPESTYQILEPLKSLQYNSTPPPAPSMKNLSLSMVGGYLVRVVGEKSECLDCKELLITSENPSPLFSLIKNQNRGGLMYPKPAFVSALEILQNFCEKVVPQMNLRRQGILQTLEDAILPYLAKCKLFCCVQCDSVDDHNENLCKLIIQKFVRPMLKNYAALKSAQVRKNCIQNKPSSRKVLRL